MSHLTIIIKTKQIKKNVYKYNDNRLFVLSSSNIIRTYNNLLCVVFVSCVILFFSIFWYLSITIRLDKTVKAVWRSFTPTQLYTPIKRYRGSNSVANAPTLTHIRTSLKYKK